jgi:hypothetical protein
MRGNNFDPVTISADVSQDDLSNLARVINQYSTQTGINAFSTEDYDRIVLESNVGYDIELTEISSPSDFKIYSLNQDFERISDRHFIDISDSSKNLLILMEQLDFYPQQISLLKLMMGS